MTIPQRGEIWRVDLEPVRGSEQGKNRPVVVMSEPTTGRATIFLCAPLMHRKREHSAMFWCCAVSPTPQNNLTKESSADAAQTRALDLSRFESRLGLLDSTELDALTTALCLCVGREPKDVTND